MYFRHHNPWPTMASPKSPQAQSRCRIRPASPAHRNYPRAALPRHSTAPAPPWSVSPHSPTCPATFKTAAALRAAFWARAGWPRPSRQRCQTVAMRVGDLRRTRLRWHERTWATVGNTRREWNHNSLKVGSYFIMQKWLVSVKNNIFAGK